MREIQHDSFVHALQNKLSRPTLTSLNRAYTCNNAAMLHQHFNVNREVQCGNPKQILTAKLFAGSAFGLTKFNTAAGTPTWRYTATTFYLYEMETSSAIHRMTLLSRCHPCVGTHRVTMASLYIVHTLNSETAYRIASAILASSSAWLGFRTGTPLTHV